jgi:hypothetical protein
MEAPNGAKKAHNGAMKAPNAAVKGRQSKFPDSHHYDVDPDLLKKTGSVSTLKRKVENESA